MSDAASYFEQQVGEEITKINEIVTGLITKMDEMTSVANASIALQEKLLGQREKMRLALEHIHLACTSAKAGQPLPEAAGDTLGFIMKRCEQALNEVKGH